jgi:hypothetical protein
MARYLTPLIPLALIAGALGFVANQSHHRRCRVVPVATEASHRPEHVAENKFAGFRIVSPSIRCAKCHEHKDYMLFP